MRAGAGLDGGHQTAEDSLTGPLPVSPHTASAAGEARGILSELAHPASLGRAHNAHPPRPQAHPTTGERTNWVSGCMPRGRQPGSTVPARWYP